MRNSDELRSSLAGESQTRPLRAFSDYHSVDGSFERSRRRDHRRVGGHRARDGRALRRRRRRGRAVGAAGRSARRDRAARSRRAADAPWPCPATSRAKPTCDALVARAVEAFGRLDVMVCNAGIGYHGPLDETPPAAMRRIVDVNLMGTLYAAHAAMRACSGGRAGPHHRGVVDRRPARRRRVERLRGDQGRADRVHRVAARRVRRHALPRVGGLSRRSRSTEFHDAIARDFGYAVSGTGPRQTAEHVAAAIVECIVSPRAEVYPLRKAWWLAVLSVIAPAQADKVVQKFARRRKPVAAAPDAHRPS